VIEMGNGGSGPGSVPDYGSDTASPAKSQGRRSTDVSSTKNVNPSTTKPADTGEDRIDSAPNDLQRQASGYDVIQAPKAKSPSDVLIPADDTKPARGYVTRDQVADTEKIDDPDNIQPRSV
jgi:hypothetical protein